MGRGLAEKGGFLDTLAGSASGGITNLLICAIYAVDFTKIPQPQKRRVRLIIKYIAFLEKEGDRPKVGLAGRVQAKSLSPFREYAFGFPDQRPTDL